MVAEAMVAKVGRVPHFRAVRITCPSCASEYEVPAVAPGRPVRCVRCGTEWAPVPAMPARLEPAPEPSRWREPVQEAPVPSRAAPDRLAEPLPLLLAWVGSGVLLAALVAASIVWRGPIMQAWPPSGRLFAALGLG